VKVYLNRVPVIGPWGGGNKTLSLLYDKLSQDKKINLTLDLKEKDIDIIFCIDPKPGPDGIWYQNFIDYKNNINKDVKIIQRVGDLGTHRGQEITNLVAQTINISDFLIFPSNWARKAIGFQKTNYAIIQNRPLSIFYDSRKIKNNVNKNKIKIVTHHWSDNPKKGFELYSAFGKKIKNNPSIEFTYIGRYNHDYSSDGINIIDPKNSKELAKLLPEFDVYLTASELEAGANHVLEAIAAGLPVIFRSGGGSIDEYCFNFGVEFNNASDLELALFSCVDNYKILKRKIEKYTTTLEEQVDYYIQVIKNLYEEE
jgi:hypothetical protein